MIGIIFKVLTNMVYHIFKRGRGIFKILFVIDDFIRLFTMTLIIPLFFSWIGLKGIMITLGVILGMVIDIHDFMSQAGISKLDK